MAVLSNTQIHELAIGYYSWTKLISPYDSTMVNPASIDLTLSQKLLRLKRQPSYVALDPKAAIEYEPANKEGDSMYCIAPGEFILGSINETITLPNNIAGQVHGKSSLGRLGLAIHVTAGWVDPGWCGKLTLEIVNHSSSYIVLHKDMRICQIVFHTLDQPANPGYQGRYQGDTDTTGSRYGE